MSLIPIRLYFDIRLVHRAVHLDQPMRNVISSNQSQLPSQKKRRDTSPTVKAAIAVIIKIVSLRQHDCWIFCCGNATKKVRHSCPKFYFYFSNSLVLAQREEGDTCMQQQSLSWTQMLNCHSNRLTASATKHNVIFNEKMSKAKVWMFLKWRGGSFFWQKENLFQTALSTTHDLSAPWTYQQSFVRRHFFNVSVVYWIPLPHGTLSVNF